MLTNIVFLLQTNKFNMSTMDDETKSQSEKSHNGGVYDVKESGIYFRHMPSSLKTPKDGEEFLSRMK